MICYQCGSVLGSGRSCLHCGANVTVYKKIVKTSNALYNSGLEKARTRDLSGAVGDLTKSLEYDKKNIRARNLLGLVYFEMGEVVDAIGHWVISKDLQPLDNIAETYIEAVQGDKHKFEEISLAIKKYNSALEAAKQDGEDMAIIQLKSVIASHPKFLKAYQLLTLLLIKEGEYSKATKVIKKGLQIDKGNVVLRSYGLEIKGKLGRPKSKQSLLIEKTAERAKEDVIVPKALQTANVKAVLISIAGTFALCLLAYFFLIRPSFNADLANAQNQNEIYYNEKTEEKTIQIAELTAEVEDLRSKSEELDKYTGESGVINNYEKLISAINAYQAGDYETMMKEYSSINTELEQSENFKTAYEKLGSSIGGDEMLSVLMESAVKDYKIGNFNTCIAMCDKILDLNPDYARAIYYKALSYEAQGDDASAAPFFKEVVEKAPGTEIAEYAKLRL